LHETGGTRAIDVSTDKSLNEVCLAIVNERQNAGYYQPPTPPADPGFGHNHLKKQPERLKELGKAVLATYKAAKAAYDVDAEEYALLTKATSQNDGGAALAYLKTRTQCQGEDFEIVEVDAAYQPSIRAVS
jgi:hypothetical protein